MTKQQVLLMALKALQEYSQLGTISNHKVIMNTILTSINDDETMVIDADQMALCSMLMVRTIERAKKNH